MFDEICNIIKYLPDFKECDKNDFCKWLESDISDPGFQILTADEIVDSVIAETNDEIVTDKEECDDIDNKGLIHSEVFKNAMAWCE